MRSPQAERLRELLGRTAPRRPRSRTARSPPGSTTAESIGELAAANGIVLHELHAEASSLEDVFLQLTREDET